ncbi:hypothetical protein GCM10011610_27310 [Nocardia rhizosphaerihabitans]|uniref:Uncharacterized protein n=1 Tax=Nocardia rhizosphaerihabitans TaxID=1691570 RepID=A0ABQ2KE84_9NOCA|nr:hypothetical protein GCM10011610_27310 [Nocardia rhizosphaerihabitans]
MARKRTRQRAKTIAHKHGLLCAAMGAAARRRPTPLIAWNPRAETKLPYINGKPANSPASTQLVVMAGPPMP